jgi:hypothetical protein
LLQKLRGQSIGNPQEERWPRRAEEREFGCGYILLDEVRPAKVEVFEIDSRSILEDPYDFKDSKSAGAPYPISKARLLDGCVHSAMMASANPGRHPPNVSLRYTRMGNGERDRPHDRRSAGNIVEEKEAVDRFWVVERFSSAMLRKALQQ